MLNLTQEVPVVEAKSKQQMLPLLVVLFVISYGLLALLVVEQARTIENQRVLIQQLFSDSVELSSLKGKNFQLQHPRPGTPLKLTPQVQAPSSQNHTPSSQANTHDNTVSQKGGTRRLQKPPKDTADTPNERRERALI